MCVWVLASLVQKSVLVGNLSSLFILLLVSGRVFLFLFLFFVSVFCFCFCFLSHLPVSTGLPCMISLRPLNLGCVTLGKGGYEDVVRRRREDG